MSNPRTLRERFDVMHQIGIPSRRGMVIKHAFENVWLAMRAGTLNAVPFRSFDAAMTYAANLDRLNRAFDRPSPMPETASAGLLQRLIDGMPKDTMTPGTVITATVRKPTVHYCERRNCVGHSDPGVYCWNDRERAYAGDY